MTFELRFPTLFTSLLAASAARRAYWGQCPHCEHTTPWVTNAARGEYRCTECGKSVLDA